MNWFNIEIKTLQGEDFADAEPDQIGIWLRLSIYCCSQENGGNIRNSRKWNERQWLRAVGITREEAHSDSALWRWNSAGGMTVAHYPNEKEREVQLKRKAGKATARKRWEKRLGKNSSATSSANSSATNSADSSVYAEEEVEGEENGKYIPRVFEPVRVRHG